MLTDFLSSHSSIEKIVEITVEPETVYMTASRNTLDMNFDFIIEGLTERNLIIRFIKVAVYDRNDELITFRHLNHNGVGNPSIHTLGEFTLEGKKKLDIFNPFFSFPKNTLVEYLRYMYTFVDQDTEEEFYYGNVIVKPEIYDQQVKLSLPLKGKLVILDGHDFYSHHRRVAISILREFTGDMFKSNFNRYGMDFSVLGEDNNLRSMTEEEKDKNYDFHFTDIKKFYTHEAIVYAPAEGEIVDIVDDLEDLYDDPFDFTSAMEEKRVKELAGNYIVIKHNDSEYSHLYHLLKGSCKIKLGDFVKEGQEISKVGFSGASNVYSHLHYQLLDGSDFLSAKELPTKFSNILLWQGSEKKKYDELVINTGDIFQQG
ncbi:hypothetical protein ES705_05588 [subsurface metagenome]